MIFYVSYARVRPLLVLNGILLELRGVGNQCLDYILQRHVSIGRMRLRFGGVPWLKSLLPIGKRILLLVASITEIRMVSPIRIIRVGIRVTLPTRRGRVVSHAHLFNSFIL